jgi:DNA-directed RNA polymerase specialized sigma24 family protein
MEIRRGGKPGGSIEAPLLALLLRRLLQFFRARVSANDVHDLVQETVARALGSDLQRAEAAEPYVMGIARNVYHDWRRARLRERPAADPWTLLPAAARALVHGGPEGGTLPGWLIRWTSRQPAAVVAFLVWRMEGASRRAAAIATGISHRQARTIEAHLRRHLQALGVVPAAVSGETRERRPRRHETRPCHEIRLAP